METQNLFYNKLFTSEEKKHVSNDDTCSKIGVAFSDRQTVEKKIK